MLLGDIIFYKCPKCGSYTHKESLLSGNTFGAKNYSDGKQIAPMLPTFPYLNKCENCGHFYWLNNKTKADINSVSDSSKKHTARFLEIDEFKGALMYMKDLDAAHERYIRNQIYWSFNDRTRNGKDIFINEDEEILYISNILFLFDLLDENKTEDLITKAEMHRNIGLFDDAIKYLDKIENKDFKWVVDRIRNKAINGEKEVFLLNP
jgi:hypothetical protein